MDEPFDTINLRAPHLTPWHLATCRPIPPVVLARKRLQTRDLHDQAYEVAWVLIASADEVALDGLAARGVMPPLADIATIQDLAFMDVVRALTELIRTRVVTCPNARPGSPYVVQLLRAPARTKAQIERQRQVDSATITPGSGPTTSAGWPKVTCGPRMVWPD